MSRKSNANSPFKNNSTKGNSVPPQVREIGEIRNIEVNPYQNEVLKDNFNHTIKIYKNKRGKGPKQGNSVSSSNERSGMNQLQQHFNRPEDKWMTNLDLVQ